MPRAGVYYLLDQITALSFHLRPSSLMVSILDSKLRGSHLIPCWIIMLSSVARHLTLSVPSLHPGVELGNSELTGKPGKKF